MRTKTTTLDILCLFVTKSLLYCMYVMLSAHHVCASCARFLCVCLCVHVCVCVCVCVRVRCLVCLNVLRVCASYFVYSSVFVICVFCAQSVLSVCARVRVCLIWVLFGFRNSFFYVCFLVHARAFMMS